MNNFIEDDCLVFSNHVRLPLSEVELTATRSQGAGGQNVNKVASAIQLRFCVAESTLPEFYKERLLQIKDSRLTKQGEIVIKGQEFRTQEMNKAAVLARLYELVKSATKINKVRKPTKPSRKAKAKRMDSKTKRGRVKSMRGKKISPFE